MSILERRQFIYLGLAVWTLDQRNFHGKRTGRMLVIGGGIIGFSFQITIAFPKQQ